LNRPAHPSTGRGKAADLPQSAARFSLAYDGRPPARIGAKPPLAVLFNTLAYAKFFAVVFLVAWMLVSRRWVAALPWVAVGAFVAFQPPTISGLGIALLSLAITVALSRAADEDRGVSKRIALASVGINFAALAWLTYRSTGLDPLTLGLSELGVPVGRTAPWLAAGMVAAPALSFLLVRARKVRLLFLLGASYVFYAHWDWRFLPLIWGSSSVDWLLGHAIHRARTPKTRKLWLIGTVILNLGVLAIFKYFDFGIDSARSALGALGVQLPELALKVALPVGISFFTFESMSYVIDVYRGHIKPQKSYFEYLSFVAFFPHLVAGPIVRPRDLLPQLAGVPRFNAREGSEGLFLIATGLVKKVAIGDYLALNLVDRVFDAPAQYSALECYVGVLGYAVQIYCDFSGYTDIAIGSALLLGVRFPLNFDAPYKAHNIANFWRRWHISLSTWLRDYLYIPLGGNKRGRVRTYANLMATMLLGGLWHGASWTFVVWGGIHGAALAVTRMFQGWRTRRPSPASSSPLLHVACVAGTFHLVLATWIFFRADTFQKAAQMFAQIGSLTGHYGNLDWRVMTVLAIGLVSHWLPERWYAASRESFLRMPAPAQGAALFCAALAVREMASAEAVPFVYFQF
jgi:alginate O-acetyltransferase complex protein AlgI